jgi:hypothetical protein
MKRVIRALKQKVNSKETKTRERERDRRRNRPQANN